MTDEPEFKIAKLRVGPDEVLVVKINGHVSGETFERVRVHVNRAFGADVRTFIIDESIGLSVVSGTLGISA